MPFPSEALGVLSGAIALGAIHGVEPGHGWPVAASYALDRGNQWAYGLAASLLIGIGHLVSSVAMVAVFFYAKSYFALADVNEPIAVDLGSVTVEIGGPVSLVAGVVLIALGVYEYRRGHGHTHNQREDHSDHEDADSHGHDHEAHGHEDHDHGSGHSHGGRSFDDAQGQGLLGIAWFAFLLGFAHEEEFEIIALCAGSGYCLELMLAYALAVICGIVGLTMLLIAGYQRYEERVERYTPYLPIFSAVVLVGMGLGFVLGVF